MGKINYIWRFIPRLAQLVSSFTPLLKKGADFAWTTVQQETFQKMQQILLSPAIMKSPVQGRPLILYIASSDVAIGALLAQEDEENIKSPIYYFSRTMRDAQLRYPKAERACLALVHAIQRFRHYLLSNRVVLVAKDDPIKILMSKPALIGRPAKWLLQISKFDIACVPPKEIKGQAVTDLLAAFPGEDITMLHEEVPVSPSGEVFSHSFKLYFHYTNNSAEYEAFLLGLSLAKKAGAMHMEIRGDSKFLVNKMNGVYSPKEVTLAPFRAEAQRMLAHFFDATIVHTGHTHNRHANCLATLASKLQFEGSEKSIIVQRRSVSSTWLTQVEDAQSSDWRAPIIHELSSSLTEGKISLKELKNFFLLHGALYYRNPDGSMSRCLGDEEASEQLKRVHEEICGQTLVVTLYRRLKRLGYYCPSMEAQSRMVQGSCPNCHTPPYHLEVLTIHHTGDWREPYIKYFHDNVLPSEKKEAIKLTQRAKRFVYLERVLCRKSFGGNLLRCLAGHEIPMILKEMHEVHDNPRKWHEELPMDLWAYRTAPKSSIRTSPYSLVHGADVILPAEIKIPSARIAVASRVQ
ncbi:uncharacterized protein LOC113295747 [Papaver somniferum]|uniref:uncharacterized protein LOC113295747 n=1 Tax=Papaver somniferum TaxID=3469 RepID=UPI000E6F49F3|nr:uncharacterized protein LOC113295747 [Papaver somniferum]